MHGIVLEGGFLFCLIVYLFGASVLFIIIGFKHIDYYSGNYFVSADIKRIEGGKEGGVVLQDRTHTACDRDAV